MDLNNIAVESKALISAHIWIESPSLNMGYWEEFSVTRVKMNYQDFIFYVRLKDTNLELFIDSEKPSDAELSLLQMIDRDDYDKIIKFRYFIDKAFSCCTMAPLV